MMRSSQVTPLCPAGHLPHKGGDWLQHCYRPSSTERRLHRPRHRVISPLVGEMAGRPEGGASRQHFKVTAEHGA
jgi:hypothetical protein